MGPKIYLLVLCGAADRPIRALGGKTPLEAAETESLDLLARRGVQGLITVIDDDICPETDSGVMALLGYDPLRYYTGRGALEALGMGFMEAGENAVGFRINFASYNDKTGELDRRTARDVSLDEQQQLVVEIRDGLVLNDFPDVNWSIAGFGRHRGIVCFKSATRALSGNVSNTDPGFKKIGPFGVPNGGSLHKPGVCCPLDASAAAAATASLVNQFVTNSAELLSRSAVNIARKSRGVLAANILLFRDGGGQVPSMQAFSERYGRTLSLYGHIPAEHGLCKLIGGQWNNCRAKPEQSEEQYYRELVIAMKSDAADVVVVHIKAADEPGHDGLPAQKVCALENFDRLFLRQLMDGGADDVYIVAGDHATPCELKIHSADRVPALVCGGPFEADCTRSFCEREATSGRLGIARAADLLPYVAQILDDK